MKDSIIYKRWIHGIIPAILIHMCVGIIYCWSLIREEASKIVEGDLSWVFPISIFFLGMSATFFSPLIEKRIKLSSFISASLFGFGMVITAISCIQPQRWMLFLGSALVGVGCGFGYLSPIKNLILWFKNNKGFIIGAAILGIGVSKIVMAPILSYFIEKTGIFNTLVLLGISSFGFMSLGSCLIKNPEGTIEDRKINWNIIKFIKLPKLLSYWLIFYFGITAGLVIISYDVLLFSVTNSILNIGGGSIITCLSISAVFNSAGRLGISWRSDYSNNRDKYFIPLLLIPMLFCLWGSHNLAVIPLVVFVCNFMYGATFSMIPICLCDRYGYENLSKLHGIILSAWAMAGLTGNQIAELILDKSGGMGGLMLFLSFLYFIGLLFSIKLLKEEKK